MQFGWLNAEFELHLPIDLIIGWGLFWFTYFLVGWLIPKNSFVIRKSENDKKLYQTLFVNLVITLLTLPFIRKVPQIIDIQNSLIRYGLFFILADCWLYSFHWLAHREIFYKYHRQHHEYIVPHALAGLYCSAPEMILINQCSLAIPLQLLGYTTYEKYIFCILAAMNVLKSHCGHDCLTIWKYKIPINSKEHEKHHIYLTCNYGMLGLFDWINSTHR